jgi:hypothetical protein
MLNTFARTLRHILNINIEKRNPFSTQKTLNVRYVAVLKVRVKLGPSACLMLWKTVSPDLCGKGSRMTYKTIESRRHLVENRMPEAR